MEAEELYAYWYSNWYYIVLLILCCGALLKYSNANKFFNTSIAWPLAIGIILYLAFRPITAKFGFGDTQGYAFFFELHKGIELADRTGDDFGYEVIQYLLRNQDVSMLFMAMGIIYVIPQLLVCKKLCPNHFGILFLIIVCSFSFKAYGVNGMRNGAALSLVMLGMTNKNFIIKIPLFIVAYSFHASALLPIAAYFITFFLKSTKVYVYIWVVSFILSLFVSNLLTEYIPLADYISDDRVSYLTNSFDESNSDRFSSTGFRWDFALYSVVPIVIGAYFVFNKIIKDRLYIQFLNVYTLCNAFWLYTIYVPYNNRFAYLSWFLYPLIISYPFINRKELSYENVSNIKKVLGFTYLFTLIMWL